MPLVGADLKRLLLAGDQYNEQTLPRFYILHAAILPVTLSVLVFVHILILRLHGVTELGHTDARSPEPRYFRFFPDHVATELLVGLVLMILLSVLATVFPVGMGPRADPQTTPEVIKPEWFFYATFRWLKLFGPATAVLSMGFIVCAMFLWPWIDRGLVRLTGQSEISRYIGVVAVLMLVGLTTWEALVAH